MYKVSIPYTMEVIDSKVNMRAKQVPVVYEDGNNRGLAADYHEAHRTRQCLWIRGPDPPLHEPYDEQVEGR